MQDQLICNGCKSVLQYRRGADGVNCLRCNTLTLVYTSEQNMSELICSGCLTLLVYTRGATNIRCSRCNRVNSTRSANQIAHLTCSQCRTTLMYPHGASTVGCASCHCINTVRGNSTGSTRPPSSDARTQTVLVENPKTLDEKGKPVNNVVVGVTTRKR